MRATVHPGTFPRPRWATSRWRFLPRLVRLLWDVNARTVVVLFLVNAAIGLSATAQVQILRQLVETAGDVVAGTAPLLAGLGWGAALGALTLTQMAGNLAERRVADHFQDVVRGVIEERAYQQAQRMPLEAFEQPAYHDQLQRVRTGMERRFFSTMAFLWRSVSHIATLLSLLVYLGQFSWLLPAVLVIGTTPGVLLRERASRRRYLLERKQTPTERHWGALAGILTGRGAAAELRLFGFGDRLIRQTERLWGGFSRERLQLAAWQARTSGLGEVINALAYFLALVVAVSLLIDRRIDIAMTAALFYAVESFQHSYFGLVWNASIIYNDLRYVEDFFAFVDGPRLDLEVGQHFGMQAPGEVRFEHVCFTYPGAGQPALRDLDLTILPGERIAVVGENGAGKSTLAKLLLGLYRPTSGRITGDGVDLADVAPADWYGRAGAVFQDFQRYQSTLRDNIALGWLAGADDSLIEQAAQRAGVTEFAAELPRGFDTLLGKEFHDGGDLSAGQWQKLAIARAYLRPAALLVLDEPAAALDAKAEAAVYAHFAQMALARTVVLISHRLGSCRLADRILVLHAGQLIEDGSHDALLAAGGRYAELYRMQAAWYRSSASSGD
ncbi:MAG TPA: ABC transporter ATP-binding protein [Chloroflexota bacterium]